MEKIQRTIKLSAATCVSLALTLPALASAQFTAPSGTNLPLSSVYNIIYNIMYWLLAIVGIVGVIGFAISGILYLTAAGDEGRIDKAKNAMLYSIIGVIVALAGLVALQFANGLLGAQSKFSGDSNESNVHSNDSNENREIFGISKTGTVGFGQPFLFGADFFYFEKCGIIQMEKH